MLVRSWCGSVVVLFLMLAACGGPVPGHIDSGPADAGDAGSPPNTWLVIVGYGEHSVCAGLYTLPSGPWYCTGDLHDWRGDRLEQLDAGHLLLHAPDGGTARLVGDTLDTQFYGVWDGFGVQEQAIAHRLTPP